MRIKDYFFEKKYHFNRFQFNLVAIFFLTVGLMAGSYLTATEVILPRLFAATSPWTQTDWSAGEGASTSNQYSSISGLTNPSGEISLEETDNWSSDYASWAYRKKITFDNTDANLGVTSETLSNFPVLVKLDTGEDIDYSKTQDSGEDIRFTDSDGTVLPYEIEEWDEADSSYIWVKVPQIDINSNSDHIYMYYGNPSVSDGQNAASVWDDYSIVYHLKEAVGTSGAGSVTDSTGNTSGTPNNVAFNQIGQIGGAADFSSSSGISTTSTVGSSILTAATTISFWINSTNYASPGRQNPINQAYGGWGTMTLESNGTINWYFGSNGGDASPYGGYNSGTVAVNGSWINIVGVRNPDGYTYSWYKNGDFLTGNTYPSTYPLIANQSLIIGDGYVNPINGKLDEVRVAKFAQTAAWIAATYQSETDSFNTFDPEQSRYPSSGTLTSNIFDAGFASDWGNISYTTAPGGTVTLKVRTSSSSTMTGATAFSSCDAVLTGTDLSSNNCVTDTHQYIQYELTMTPSGSSSPALQEISIAFSASDQVAPTVNATSVSMTGIGETAWTNTLPTFTFNKGEDNDGGGGLLGYCISLDSVSAGGTPPSNDPASSSGDLPGNGVNANCPYVVSASGGDTESFDLSGVGIGLSSGYQYYLSIKAIDTSGNIWTGEAADYQNLASFKYDNTRPTNVTYISPASGNFSNVVDMSFSWPTEGSSASSDSGSGVLGWQYQINGTDPDSWQGTTHHQELDLDYIPATASSYTLVASRDEGAIVSGSNTVYFRTVDSVGNFSTDATVRTGSLSFGGDAPSFGGTDKVTITPSTSTENSFALSWPSATAANGQEVAGYYYMVNTSPPSTLSTLQSNATTYVSAGTGTSISTSSLGGVNKGTNTVYVVAIDNADTPNYSPSNYISGTFTLNSTDPNNPGDLVASDSSIKSQSQWNVTLTWTAPSYQGAGNLTYLVYRSTDGTTFSQVGSTSGLSYVDNAPSSTLYYYKLYAKDGANSQSSGTNAVSITPTGKWTTAPSLESGPTVSSITTKKATITWSTSRTSDSKISYGTSSGSYFDEEPSNSSQVTAHTINLTNLSPGTTYYYKAKWTDEDGNTGTSDEKSFTTDPAPTAKDVLVTNLGLSSATINYTVSGATKVKIYYGETTSFGGSVEVSTSTTETTYSTVLSGLNDGTKYYYKINTFDEEDAEYEGTVLDFTTLPRPKISQVRIQQVAGTAQPTVLISWNTNTEVSSIVTYYPSDSPSSARDEVNVALVKGEHKMIVRGLFPQTPYTLIVKGRDKIGNEAVSSPQRFTTATDTRPPQITELSVEGTNVPLSSGSSNESSSQLIVSWNTDEPSTSQVEFGEGTGTVYSQKTQEDTNLTYNHLVIISGLTPSKVYHLRAISKDKAGNQGTSIDSVTITPKETDNALNLVITNLSEAFGFLGGLGR